LAHLTDVAQQAGLTQPVIYGGVNSKSYIIEVVGCGVAFIDTITTAGRICSFSAARAWKERRPARPIACTKTTATGTFTDVTTRAGAAPHRLGVGCDGG